MSYLSKRRGKAKEKAVSSEISDELRHVIVYEWAHYMVSIDELANKYGLHWDQIFEVIKSSPTSLLWKRPKK